MRVGSTRPARRDPTCRLKLVYCSIAPRTPPTTLLAVPAGAPAVPHSAAFSPHLEAFIREQVEAGQYNDLRSGSMACGPPSPSCGPDCPKLHQARNYRIASMSVGSMGMGSAKIDAPRRRDRAAQALDLTDQMPSDGPKNTRCLVARASQAKHMPPTKPTASTLKLAALP